MEWHIRDAQLITVVLLFSLGSSVHLSTVRRGKDKAVGLKSRKKSLFVTESCGWRETNIQEGNLFHSEPGRKKKQTQTHFLSFHGAKKLTTLWFYLIVIFDRHCQTNFCFLTEVELISVFTAKVTNPTISTFFLFVFTHIDLHLKLVLDDG